MGDDNIVSNYNLTQTSQNQVQHLGGGDRRVKLCYDGVQEQYEGLLMRGFALVDEGEGRSCRWEMVEGDKRGNKRGNKRGRGG